MAALNFQTADVAMDVSATMFEQSGNGGAPVKSQQTQAGPSKADVHNCRKHPQNCISYTRNHHTHHCPAKLNQTSGAGAGTTAAGHQAQAGPSKMGMHIVIGA
jgi:hypothetical protein